MTDLVPETILTERLRLERLGPDNPPTLELYEHGREGAPAIDEITRYMGWSPYATPHDPLEFQQQVDEGWEEATSAVYAIRPREGEDGAGEFAGDAGLHVDWDRRLAAFGIWLRKRFWGRGYSGERADAFVELAFGRLDLEVVGVGHVVGNENSRKAIERYIERHGGRLDGRFRNMVSDDDGAVHDVLAYSIAREEWADAGGGDAAEVTYVD